VVFQIIAPENATRADPPFFIAPIRRTAQPALRRSWKMASGFWVCAVLPGRLIFTMAAAFHPGHFIEIEEFSAALALGLAIVYF
jgi:hypothetical protein